MPKVRGMLVEQMQGYGKFLQEHAEDIIGKLDSTYVAENGVRVSFTLSDKEAPHVSIECLYLAVEAFRYGKP